VNDVHIDCAACSSRKAQDRIAIFARRIREFAAAKIHVQDVDRAPGEEVMKMASQDRPIQYMERTRHYYRALGYEHDYVWARFNDVPFSRLARPLAETRIGLITTASPPRRDNVDGTGRRHVWSSDTASPPAGLFTANLAWDKESTHTDDLGSYLPLEVAAELVSERLLAGVTARFHGVPTEYSQRKTMEEDAPQILSRLREDGADAAILCAL